MKNSMAYKMAKMGMSFSPDERHEVVSRPEVVEWEIDYIQEGDLAGGDAIVHFEDGSRAYYDNDMREWSVDSEKDAWVAVE